MSFSRQRSFGKSERGSGEESSRAGTCIRCCWFCCCRLGARGTIAGKVRGRRRRVSTSSVAPKKTQWPGKIVLRIREGLGQTYSAGASHVGRSFAWPLASEVRSAIVVPRFRSPGLRRHAARVPADGRVGAAFGDRRQGRFGADHLEHVDRPPDVGCTLVLAAGPRRQGERTHASDSNDPAFARLGVGGHGCGLCGLQRDAETDGSPGDGLDADVVRRHLLHRRRAQTPGKDFRDGIVYYWPKSMQDKGQPTGLRGRSLRITSRRRKHEVCFTNVEDRVRLPLRVAAQFYRWRWENEGFFRTYKRTLQKAKLPPAARCGSSIAKRKPG